MGSLRTKYTDELAVLLTWLCALLPWSVTVASIGGITAVHVRFVPLRFLYVLGADLPGEKPFLPVWGVPDFVASEGVTTAAWIWVAGAALFTVAFAFSVAYYLAEDRVAGTLPADPVRVLGGLLLAVGVVFGFATALLFQHQLGTTLPVGTLFLLLFGVVLLRVQEA
jgi:uncharacterized protein (TIGR04206 family)